jgi:hypothetical protein
MDLRSLFRRNIFSPAWYSPDSTRKSRVELGPSTASLRNRANNGDLRLIVERQFMRMNEAHDRHRTAVLASYSPPNMK